MLHDVHLILPYRIRLTVVPITFSSNSLYIQFYNLSANTTYHVKPSPNMLPTGWVLIDVESAFTTAQGLGSRRGITW
jgi:hypothetical protein